MVYKVGEKVKIVDCGNCYSDGGGNEWKETVRYYIRRYKPCNAYLVGDEITIFSGWNQGVDLSKRSDLKWKIRYVVKSSEFLSIYIVQSNENHMLLINDMGIRDA